jgi:hypothetical protein
MSLVLIKSDQNSTTKRKLQSQLKSRSKIKEKPSKEYFLKQESREGCGRDT